MRAVRFRGTTFASLGLRAGTPEQALPPVTLAPLVQERPGRDPLVTGYTRSPRELTLTVVPVDATGYGRDDLEALAATVNTLFALDGAPAPLVLAWADGAEREGDVLVTRVEGVGIHEWRVTLLVPGTFWRDVSEATGTTSPLTVGGNVATRPVVEVTGGAASTRRRVTVTDRTGQGLIGWLVGITWGHPAGETLVVAHGLALPFVVAGGRLWFRVDVQAGVPTLVDAWHSTAIANTTTAGALDAAGTTLGADLAGGSSVTAELRGAPSRPSSAALCWLPGRTAAHDQPDYTFGFTSDDSITLIDRTRTGARYQLDDDFDSWVLTSPVELATLDGLQLEVFAGKRAATDEADAARRNRVQTMSAADGPVTQRLLLAPQTWPMSEPSSEDQGGFEPQLVLRLDSQTVEVMNARTVVGDPPVTTPAGFKTAAELQTAMRARIGGSVNVAQGATPYTYLVEFPQGSFDGEPIPLFRVETDDVIPEVLVDAAWWDMVADAAILDESAGEAEPTTGVVRAVVRALYRDGEPWLTLWRQEVAGAAVPGTTVSLSVPTLTLDGAIAVAVGLEAAADDTQLTWGSLTPTADPVVTFQSGRTPQVQASDAIAGVCQTGAVTNTTTGQQISFNQCLSDGGVSIDCDALWVEALEGVGPPPVNPPLLAGSDWLRLAVGSNAWAASGNLSGVTWRWRARWQE